MSSISSLMLFYGMVLVAFIICEYGTSAEPEWVASLGYEEKEPRSYHRKCTGALIESKGEKSYKGRLVLTTGRCAKELKRVNNPKAILLPAGKLSVLKTKKRKNDIIKIFPTTKDTEFAIALVDAEMGRPGASLPKEDLTGQKIRAAEWLAVSGSGTTYCPYKLTTIKLGKLSGGAENDPHVKEDYIRVRSDGKGKNGFYVMAGSPIYASNATLVGLLDKVASGVNFYYDITNEAWRMKIDSLISEVETELTEKAKK